jgi:dTDP-glucose 4,6-dehydratase
MKKILITGTLGFIFSNFIKKVVDQYPEYTFVGIDNATEKYRLKNLFKHQNYQFYLGDIADAKFIDNVFTIERPDIVINGAAASFVDDSIKDILPFIHSNILGTQIMVSASLKHNVENFVHISTDEIYGQKYSINDTPWTENEPVLASNPYSCSKASAELIIRSAHHTHNLQFNMTRSSNVFGPYQKYNNLIPHVITSLMNNTPIHIHGNGKNFRQWVYVDDKIDAIMQIIKSGKINEIYNIGAPNYSTNLEMVKSISKIMNVEPKIKFIEDRKAHDFGYSVSTEKLKEIGWSNKTSFDDGLKNTVEWYLNNQNYYA